MLRSILNCGLSSRDFEISARPSVSVLTPYIESSLAKSLGVKSSGDSTAEDSSKTAISQNVLYSYPVSVNILGTKANAKKLIDLSVYFVFRGKNGRGNRGGT